MPKSFSDSEKETIRQELMDQGETIFSQYGLKKATIEDITSAVGIAKGSFYAFFPTKEKLLLEIFKVKERELREVLRAQLEDLFDRPREAFDYYLRFQLDAINQYPIIKTLLDSHDMKNFIRRLPPEDLEELAQIDDSFNLQIIQEFQTRGIIKPISPKVINAMFRSFFMMIIENMGGRNEDYIQAMDIMIEMMVDYLVIK